MKVASWAAPRAGTRRAAAPALAVLLLSSCGTTDEMAGLDAADSSWRVIERLGEARYRRPDATGWTPVTAGSRIPGGAEVTTGTGGRMIVAAKAVQVSAGPESIFILPDPTQDDDLSHVDGRLRYRLSGEATETLKVVTPHAELLAVTGVFDVLVDAASTVVEVGSGELRLATIDDRRQATLVSGQSALARDRGGPALAVRNAPGLPYQRVEKVALSAPPSPPYSTPLPPVTRETHVLEAVEARGPYVATAATEPSPPTQFDDRTVAEEPSAPELVDDRTVAEELSAPEPVDDGVAEIAEPQPTPVQSVATEPLGPPEADGGKSALSGPTVRDASQPRLATGDSAKTTASELSVGAMQIPASFPHAEVEPLPEIVLPATTSEEARQIYGRLADGMLERLPSASE